MDVSIIIVSFNTKKLTLDCINSIYKQTIGLTFEIIVSDNGSTDGSIEAIRKSFPKVIILENNLNLGFGAANNKAKKIASGSYILYLNSDTVLLNNATKYFYDYYENKKNLNIGALGCNLLDENFRLTTSFGKFPDNKKIFKDLIGDLKQLSKRSLIFFINNGNIKKNIKKEKEYYVGEVDYISGADLFLKNDDNALFDETFFLYFEDTDLNKRLELNGLKRIIIEGPKIQHLEHKSNNFKSKLNFYASFSKINYNYSAIHYMAKYLNSNINLFCAKLLLTLQWINPFIFNNTKKYLKSMWNLKIKNEKK